MNDNIKQRHLGKLRISTELLLKWLDFTSAEIRESHYDYASDTIELLLECDEFPTVPINQEPPIITPNYITYQDAQGNKVVIRSKTYPAPWVDKHGKASTL